MNDAQRITGVLSPVVTPFKADYAPDPERFEEPDALDLASKRESRHLGFGRGRHFCLGAPLARLETEIALGTLLRRLPGLRLGISPDELRWRPVPLFRSLVELPVAWGV